MYDDVWKLLILIQTSYCTYNEDKIYQERRMLYFIFNSLLLFSVTILHVHGRFSGIQPQNPTSNRQTPPLKVDPTSLPTAKKIGRLGINCKSTILTSIPATAHLWSRCRKNGGDVLSVAMLGRCRCWDTILSTFFLFL